MSKPTDLIDLPIFIQWLDFLKWLLVTTDRFPKKARFTFSDRLNQLGLGVVEDLVEARYSKDKNSTLKRINLNLEKMRVLLRISYELRFLSGSHYEQAMKRLQEIGKMLGGWIKQNQALGASNRETRAEFI